MEYELHKESWPCLTASRGIGYSPVKGNKKGLHESKCIRGGPQLIQLQPNARTGRDKRNEIAGVDGRQEIQV